MVLASKCTFKDSVFRLRNLMMLVLLYGLAPACGDIERDNPLDPQHPESTRPQTVLIEAFVNINDSLQHNINEYALAALDNLYSIHAPDVIIVDYHRNTLDYIDPYHRLQNETLYQRYIGEFNAVSGVPDVFFNGTLARVQGASSINHSIQRIGGALQPFLNQNSPYALEIGYDRNGDQVIPRVTVARLNRPSLSEGDIIIKALLVARIDNAFLRRVVRDDASSSVQTISKGEVRNFTLPALTVSEPQYSHSLVVYLTDRNEIEVFQCAVVEVK